MKIKSNCFNCNSGVVTTWMLIEGQKVHFKMYCPTCYGTGFWYATE